MKRLLGIATILFLSIGTRTWAQIAFSSFQSCKQSNSSMQTCSAQMTLGQNDLEILYASETNNSFTTTVSNCGSQAWVHQSSASFTFGTSEKIDAWTLYPAPAGTCNITVTRTSATGWRFQWVAANYSGAVLGSMTGVGNSSQSTCTVSLNTQDSNNFVVAGFGNNTGETYTAITGNLRGQTNNTGASSAISDNSAASPSSVTNTVGLSANASCAAGAIELRSCGPPLYLCSSTSLANITYPSTPPPIGSLSSGHGTIFTDPIFGAKGVRLTDSSFDPSLFGNANNAYSVSNGGSADDQWFNNKSTLTLVTSQGATRYLVALNPGTLALSRPYATNTSGCPNGNCSARGGWSINIDDLAFSRVGTYLLYAQSGSSLLSYTFDGPNYTNPPSPVTVENYVENEPSGCTGVGCNCLPADFGPPSWTSWAGTTVNDGVFGAAFSSTAYHYGSSTGQGPGYYVTVYSPTNGCMAYNTQTGAITADPGWAGGSGLSCNANACTGTAALSQRYTIHNVKLNNTGSQIAIQYANCISGTCTSNVPFLWIIGTTTVFESQITKFSGHWALGTDGMLNYPVNPPAQIYYRTEGSGGPGVPTAVNTIPSPDCSVFLDMHIGWQMNNATDSFPFAFTTYTGSLLNYGLLPFDQPQCPWWEEIDMADANGDGLVHREALTFNTGYSVFFNAEANIATCSQDGQFCSVGSDWLNTLGNAAGTSSSCISIKNGRC